MKKSADEFCMNPAADRIQGATGRILHDDPEIDDMAGNPD
jgi:hypothetical protein